MFRLNKLRALLMVLALHTGSWAQDRTELVNRSSQPWTLSLVEGVKAGRGTLTLVDKFTGKTTGALAKVGDTLTLPARSHQLLVFNREGGYLFRDFLLRDPNGYYAEYLATVEFLSTPKVSISLVDHHVGPPLDHSDEGAIKQFLGDAIEIGSENIIIHPNSLCLPATAAQRSAEAPWTGRVLLPTS